MSWVGAGVGWFIGSRIAGGLGGLVGAVIGSMFGNGPKAEEREEEARRRDLPPFKVINNERLVELSRDFEGRASCQVGDLPKLPRHFGPETRERIAELIRGAAQIPEEEWPRLRLPRPVPPPSPHPAVYERLKAVRQKMCEELDLEDSLLATKPQLTSLALHSRATEEEIRSGTPMMEWQYGLWIPKIVEPKG